MNNTINVTQELSNKERQSVFGGSLVNFASKRIDEAQTQLNLGIPRENEISTNADRPDLVPLPFIRNPPKGA